MQKFFPKRRIFEIQRRIYIIISLFTNSPIIGKLNNLYLFNWSFIQLVNWKINQNETFLDFYRIIY
jgi:hypothetical protein